MPGRRSSRAGHRGRDDQGRGLDQPITQHAARSGPGGRGPPALVHRLVGRHAATGYWRVYCLYRAGASARGREPPRDGHHGAPARRADPRARRRSRARDRGDRQPRTRGRRSPVARCATGPTSSSRSAATAPSTRSSTACSPTACTPTSRPSASSRPARRTSSAARWASRTTRSRRPPRMLAALRARHRGARSASGSSTTGGSCFAAGIGFDAAVVGAVEKRRSKGKQVHADALRPGRRARVPAHRPPAPAAARRAARRHAATTTSTS